MLRPVSNIKDRGGRACSSQLKSQCLVDRMLFHLLCLDPAGGDPTPREKGAARLLTGS